ERACQGPSTGAARGLSMAAGTRAVSFVHAVPSLFGYRCGALYDASLSRRRRAPSKKGSAMTDDARPPIHDNVAAHRFEMIVDRHAAVATYAIDGDTIT